MTWTHGTIVFDKRGIMETTVSPFLGGTLRLTTTADADYDCMRISQTRILMGKWGTICNAK
jgi:hypothetical protein